MLGKRGWESCAARGPQGGFSPKTPDRLSRGPDRAGPFRSAITSLRVIIMNRIVLPLDCTLPRGPLPSRPTPAPMWSAASITTAPLAGTTPTAPGTPRLHMLVGTSGCVDRAPDRQLPDGLFLGRGPHAHDPHQPPVRSARTPNATLGTAVGPHPPWPGDTRQMGVYYVRGPW